MKMNSDDSTKKYHCLYNVDDEEVVDDILECSSNDKIEIEVSECCNDDDDNDTDVCSNSSFSGTVSQHDDDDETEQTASNDQEADSLKMCTDASASLPFCFRRKKLSDHWRRFIHPITWRCKWLELKIKELQSQAGKYDKKLVEASLSLPLKTRLKKRRKRKRVEEASSDGLNLNLFSYHENRKSFADLALNDKRNKNAKEEAVFCEEEETLPFEFREGDEYLEEILLNLKNRLDKLVNENPSMLTSVNTLNMLVSEQQNEEEPVKSTSVSSHHNDTQPEEDDESTDILLSEMMASSRQREGKAIVLLGNKQQKTEQEGSSRPVRIRKPRNLDVEVKEETKRKRRKVSKEKPPKRSNRQRKRGKRRSGGSTGSRRRS